MDSRSVFFEEWLRSLREQYKHVVRNNDLVTLPTLTAVMQNVGFSEDELKQLRLEATIRVEDVPQDFKPDMKILEPTATSVAHPAECHCPQCIAIDDGAHDADGQPIVPDPEEASAETGLVFPAAAINQPEDDEPDPVTFADSLDLEDAAASDDSSPLDSAEEEDGGAVDDADAPEQMNLF